MSMIIRSVVCLSLAACGSSSFATVADDAPHDSGVTPHDSAMAAHDSSMVEHDGSMMADVGSDVAMSGDAHGMDAGVDVADVGVDVQSDVQSDVQVDAAVDAQGDAGVDAVADSGCVDGTKRCVDYAQETCAAGTYSQDVGDQSCCHDPRFTVAGGIVTDSTTGYHWKQGGGMGTFGNAGTLCAPYRLPTMAELSTVIIGGPAPRVCSPTVDQSVFISVYAGFNWTNDGGCLSLNGGSSFPSCGGSLGFLCISP